MSLALPENISLLSALPEELTAMVKEEGLPAYRGEQLFSWLHKKKVVDCSKMGNLPASFRQVLDANGPILPLKRGQVLKSKDGTRKLEVLLEDGQVVETVLIPEGDKITQCISSQVGCAVGCVFCRSGKAGLKRNLSAAEILGQIHLATAEYFPGERLSNVVLMGVGEPLHNVDRVLRAIQLMCHPDGLALSSRRVTLSTVGIVKGIEKLAQKNGGKTALAISLHAATDDVRSYLVPGVSSKLSQIIDVLKRYPLPPRMRFTIEYVLVKGVNDSDADARKLVRLLSPLRVKVNLLPLNPHDLTDLKTPDENRVLAFQQILVSKGVSVFLRRRRGADINAACGQLLACSNDK